MKFNVATDLARVLISVFVAGTASSFVYADDATQLPLAPPVELKTQAAPPGPSPIFGTLDMRGEYYGVSGAFDTSNYAQLGYAFTPDVKVSWYQGFDSNINNSPSVPLPASAGANPAGLNPIFDQGFLRTRVNNIWSSGNLSFAYESRIYVPTLPFDAAQGNVTRLYNAFKLIDKVNDVITLTAVEVMSPNVYKVAGTPQYGANNFYENRNYLVADFQITKKLSFSFPIIFFADWYRDYAAGALNNGSVAYILYIWPELDYAINDNLTVGLAYVSDNLVQYNTARFQERFSDGFKNGLVQFVVTTTL